MFVLIDRWTLILKNRGKKSFVYETKALTLFILMRKISLWFPIMKKKRLLCETVFIPIDKWILILKNGGKKRFSHETKASTSFIPIRRVCVWCPIMKKREIIMWFRICLNWHMSFDSKNMMGRKAFLMKPKHQWHLSQWGDYVYVS